MIRIILLCLISSVAMAQNFYKMTMEVAEVNENDLICHDEVSVYWGTFADTLIFAFDSPYGPRALKLWGKFHYKKGVDKPEWLKWIDIHKKEELQGNSVFYMTDGRDQRYFVRFIRKSTEGMIVFVENLSSRYPVYLFDFTANNLCK